MSSETASALAGDITVSATSFHLSALLNIAKRFVHGSLAKAGLTAVAANPAPAPDRDNVTEQVDFDRDMIEARHIDAMIDPLEVNGGNVDIHAANVDDQMHPVQRLI